MDQFCGLNPAGIGEIKYHEGTCSILLPSLPHGIQRRIKSTIVGWDKNRLIIENEVKYKKDGK